jgi:hypothetical protein
LYQPNLYICILARKYIYLTYFSRNDFILMHKFDNLLIRVLQNCTRHQLQQSLITAFYDSRGIYTFLHVIGNVMCILHAII